MADSSATMAKAGGKRNRKGGPKQSEAQEIQQLEAAILAGAPAAGSTAVSTFDRAATGKLGSGR